MAEVPEKLGKYHILELIAQGGMAEVYKAKTIGIAGFEKVLALKRIRPRYANEPRFIRNFVDEARIAVSLNHRNIVQVFDFGKADGELFLAMELLEGVDLRMAVAAAREKGERIPPALACYILADVAVGLDYAHRKCDSEGNYLGIVHCDVSPHNVLLSTEGFVKILDFGVARARFVAAPTSRRLRGKPRYMAPEQTLGDTPTPASDVFVVGILAWELLTGRQLFDGKDVKAILRAVRESEVPHLRSLTSDLPEYLTDAVMRALNREPEQRGTASEIGVQLARAGRELSNESSAQALSDWLNKTFPTRLPPEETATDVQAVPPALAQAIAEETTGTAPTAPASPRLAMTDAQEDPDTATGSGDASDGTDEGAQEDLSAPALEALIDKRRVVVTILLLDGGMEDRRRQLSSALCDLAYKRGAVIHEHGENEVVAIFGLEVAGEDDVASAMHFAIDAADLARDTVGQAEGVQLIRLRSAARAGVVAQRKEGTYQLRGDSLREARELARGAEANRPLLSGGTGRLASTQFRFRELPTRRYRSRRLRVLELIGPSGHEDRARALRDRPGRFIGRESELESLWTSYQDCVTANKPSGHLVTGPAGVGKSRLVAEFVARIDESDSESILFAVAATEHATDSPFTVTIEYMQAALKLAPGRGEQARAELIQRLGSTLREAGRSDEQVASACESIELAMELRDGALNRSQEAPSALRERCAESVRLTHQALTSGQPSVLVLENFHQADAASIEVLRLILEGPDCEGATMILMTCRDDSLCSALPTLPTVELKDLDPEERILLISDRLADSRKDEVVHEVARRAGGNPLYIEELCRNIREVGWEETPATVRDTVVSRIDRLTRRSRAALQRAAVIGESFRARILEELIAAPATENLQELVEEGLLLRSDQAEFEADGGVYSFRHGLIQEVVYGSLSAGARKATHAKLGKLLSLRDEAGRDEPPVLTARHLELGGLLFESCHYWTKAGRVALAAFETLTAREAFGRALDIHHRLTPEQQAERQGEHIETLFGRARANRDLGNHDEQGEDLQELAPLVEGDLPGKAELLTRTANRHLRSGAFEDAIEDARAAADIANQAQVPLLEGEALRLIGEAYERTGKFDAGLEVTGKALSIFERLNARPHETRARISMARSHLIRARYAEALGIYQPILAEVSRNRDPWIERLANNHLAVIYMCLGEFETAIGHAEKSVELCEVDGDQARAGDNLSVCGTILHEVGQYDEAQKRFQQALTLLKATKSRWSMADCLIYAGTNNAKLGHLDKAFEQVEMAYQEAKELKAPYIESNAAIALAGLYLQRAQGGDLELAEKTAEHAASLAREATLSGAQALALSRQAEAMRRLGARQRGLVISRSAINILDRQRHIEGSEEEILYTHHLLLSANHSPDAQTFLERAARVFERKLNALTDHSWRRSFAEEVPASVGILEAQENTEND